MHTLIDLQSLTVYCIMQGSYSRNSLCAIESYQIFRRDIKQLYFWGVSSVKYIVPGERCVGVCMCVCVCVCVCVRACVDKAITGTL